MNSSVKSKVKKNNTFEISRREENLRKKFEIIENRSIEKLEKIRIKNDKKINKINQKIDKSRIQQEEKILRESNSKIFAKSHFLYILLSPFFIIGRFLKKCFLKISKKRHEIIGRRPHESFKMTPRAKTRRGINMSGYFTFVGEAFHLIILNKWLFTKFIMLYSVIAIFIVGILDQETFQALRDSINSVSDQSEFAKNAALAVISTGNMVSQMSTLDFQGMIGIILFIYGWLTLIWLIRSLNNGEKPNLRDGLYNSGNPAISIAVIILVISIQLIPLAIVMLAYNSLTAVGWINSSIMIENMASWFALATAAILSLYWICSSFIALVIATLPGVYPLKAIKIAGDLVVSRRMDIVLRLLMMCLPIAILWLVVLIPTVWFDSWLISIGITWIPLVPFITLIVAVITLIFAASYIYLLYRRMVDDPTPPIRSDWKKRRDELKEVRARNRAAKKLLKLSKNNREMSVNFREKLTRRAKLGKNRK